MFPRQFPKFPWHFPHGTFPPKITWTFLAHPPAEHHSLWAFCHRQFKIFELRLFVSYSSPISDITHDNTWDRCASYVITTWPFIIPVWAYCHTCVSVLCLFSLPECFVVPSSMLFGDVTDLANKCVNTRPPVIHIHHVLWKRNRLYLLVENKPVGVN